MSTSPVPRPLSEDLLIFLWDFLFNKFFFTLPKARASKHCWTQDNSPPTAPLPQGWYHLPLQRGGVLRVWAQRRVHSWEIFSPSKLMNSTRRPSLLSLLALKTLPVSPIHPFSSATIKLVMMHSCDFCVPSSGFFSS